LKSLHFYLFKGCFTEWQEWVSDSIKHSKNNHTFYNLFKLQTTVTLKNTIMKKLNILILTQHFNVYVTSCSKESLALMKSRRRVEVKLIRFLKFLIGPQNHSKKGG
jgi:hypothetical protein